MVILKNNQYMRGVYFLVFFTLNWSTKVQLNFFIRFCTLYMWFPLGSWNYWFMVLTNLHTRIEFWRPVQEFAVYVRPESVLAKGYYPTSPGMFWVKVFQNWILYQIEHCNPFIHAHTSEEMQVTRGSMQVWLTSIPCCLSFCMMQLSTSFNTASLLINTSKKPLLKDCVRLFSKISFFDSSRLGVVGPSFDDLVELTAELEVDWKVTRVAGAGELQA